jgi:hypothetical protein
MTHNGKMSRGQLSRQVKRLLSTGLPKEDYKRSEGRQCSLPASMAASSTDEVSF